MDTEFMSGLFLSVLMFAPGVVLLTTCGLVGIAMILEKIGLLGSNEEDLKQDLDQSGT